MSTAIELPIEKLVPFMALAQTKLPELFSFEIKMLPAGDVKLPSTDTGIAAIDDIRVPDRKTPKARVTVSIADDNIVRAKELLSVPPDLARRQTTRLIRVRSVRTERWRERRIRIGRSVVPDYEIAQAVG